MLGAFGLVTPAEILFGRGHIAQLNDRATKLGTRALVVHGRNPGRLSGVIEPFLSSRSNLFTDMLCQEAIPKGLQALKQLMDRESEEARDSLAQVSLFGGLALANSGLGVVHGIAGPLGGLCGAPHGAICGALLPAGIAANRDNVVEVEHIARIDRVIDWIAEVFETSRGQALHRFRQWIIQNGLPGLASIGVTEEHIISASQAAASSSSMKANPVVLSTASIENVMRYSL